MKKILVFKTSVKRKTDVQRLTSVLDDLMANDDRWNFDLEDHDKILRVESELMKSTTIESVLQGEGYYCAELED